MIRSSSVSSVIGPYVRSTDLFFLVCHYFLLQKCATTIVIKNRCSVTHYIFKKTDNERYEEITLQQNSKSIFNQVSNL